MKSTLHTATVLAVYFSMKFVVTTETRSFSVTGTFLLWDPSSKRSNSQSGDIDSTAILTNSYSRWLETGNRLSRWIISIWRKKTIVIFPVPRSAWVRFFFLPVLLEIPAQLHKRLKPGGRGYSKLSQNDQVMCMVAALLHTVSRVLVYLNCKTTLGYISLIGSHKLVQSFRKSHAFHQQHADWMLANSVWNTGQ